MKFIVETEQEEDGRWIAEVIDLPGILVYAQTCEEAITQVQALALRVLAERLENGETESKLVINPVVIENAFKELKPFLGNDLP
jgi:predicted RNase H-like HicB family nuclease